MIGLYKWAIGLVCTVLLALGMFYMNNAEADQRLTRDQLLNHETRITTLEESKRNTELLLERINESLEKIRDAVGAVK